MQSRIINGEPYYLVNYQSILDDLPILNMEKRSLSRGPFEKLIRSGVLQRKIVKDKGTYSYYAVGENYEKLVCEQAYYTSHTHKNQSYQQPESTVGKGEYLP